jgi:hypothetical protein
MGLLLFGRKVRKIRRKVLVKKPPANIIKQCKKYRIKTTIKRGSKRVYKKTSVLKRQIKKARKNLKKKTRRTHKVRKTRKTRKVRRVRRRFHFGESAPFSNQTPDYGYNTQDTLRQGILNQSVSIVDDKSNINRPPGFGLNSGSIPVYGTYAPFFGEKVPRVVPPNWDFMGQPDGSLYAVGSPFSRYTTPNFGKRMRRRRVRNIYS